MEYDEIPLALRPFIAALEEHCRNLSKEELVETILSLAGELSPRERSPFLDRISRASGRAVRSFDVDDLISRIEGICEDIAERRSAIEDGSYWDDYQNETDFDRYGWDADPSPVTNEQIDVLKSLFSEADTLFLDGELIAAAAAYRLLLAPFEDFDPYEPSLYLRERRARLAQSVYLLCADDGRLEAMADVMRPEVRSRLGFETDSDLDDTLPMFADVLDAAPGELPDLDRFLRSWTDRFANTHGTRSELLYIEALYLTEGIAGLAFLARQWGGLRPRGYLAWIERLLQCAEWETAVSASREALNAIPTKDAKLAKFRLRAAHCLGQAGDQLGDPALMLESAHSIFSIDPSNDTLMKLVQVSGNRKDETLTEAVGLLHARKDRRYLLAKALLMAGRMEETLTIARGCKPVGWSYGDNPAGLCFAAILALPVLDRLEQHPAIHELLKTHAAAGGNECPAAGKDAEKAKSLIFEEIRRGIGSATLSAAIRPLYLRWARDIGERRIDHIVSNKHRSAYRRAAQVLAALYERHTYDGDVEEARELIERYRSRYNRHTAFKRELNHVLPFARTKT